MTILCIRYVLAAADPVFSINSLPIPSTNFLASEHIIPIVSTANPTKSYWSQLMVLIFSFYSYWPTLLPLFYCQGVSTCNIPYYMSSIGPGHNGYTIRSNARINSEARRFQLTGYINRNKGAFENIVDEIVTTEFSRTLQTTQSMNPLTVHRTSSTNTWVRP
uniref:Uncharacterized protein n=1 Tax=Cacopsylla melanoneura TaxID=428564 RepID=A0A8D8QJI7_9HEMI